MFTNMHVHTHAHANTCMRHTKERVCSTASNKWPGVALDGGPQRHPPEAAFAGRPVRLRRSVHALHRCHRLRMRPCAAKKGDVRWMVAVRHRPSVKEWPAAFFSEVASFASATPPQY